MDLDEAEHLLKIEGSRVVAWDLADLERLRTDRLKYSVTGASGTEYQVELNALPEGAHPGEEITVLLCIDDGGRRAFAPLCATLAVYSDGKRSALRLKPRRQPMRQRLFGKPRA